MCKAKYISHVFLYCLITFTSVQAHAMAISVANGTFYWDSLTINGTSVDNRDFIVTTEVSLFNDVVDERYIQGDSFDTFLDKSNLNVSAVAGYDDIDESYVVSTIADSIFSDQQPAAAEAITTVYVPFEADNTEQANISFFYDLFASADALFPGEFALAISAISFSLLDDAFSEIESGFFNDLFATTEGGEGFPDQILGFTDYTFSNLTEGDAYFLAVDTFAFSSTEAVPEPATLLLILLGLAFLLQTKNFYPSKQLSNRLQS